MALYKALHEQYTIFVAGESACTLTEVTQLCKRRDSRHPGSFRSFLFCDGFAYYCLLGTLWLASTRYQPTPEAVFTPSYVYRQ